MSVDEDIPPLPNAENVRISDGTSTAGEHNVDLVKDTTVKENIQEDTLSNNEVVQENNKEDTDAIEKNGVDDGKDTRSNEAVQEVTDNSKIRSMDSTSDQIDEANLAIPHEEVIVV